MNKLLVLASIVSLTIIGCSEKKPAPSTTTTVEKRDMKGIKIAYYNSDSLKEKFIFFKEQDSMMNAKQKGFEAEMQRKQIADYQQNQGQALEKEAIDKMTVIGNKVEKFAKEFSQKNKIDILLIHGKGGQIGFIETNMDVTKEFVNYLNEKQAEIAKDLK